ncbi:dehydrodolichyl diphosphate synthase 6-like [Dioscorea cayenensis subsp. rotundata]|uniref:Alkyl transferase n=1 Tax=Dioscorea cayennensis subsp. rotundata TaxID=55577 RepID=A0AB40CFD8_DIOCR|nr:dehydrodolichyl diphosphate synthase 6-like [Dioscorea cayenensis subsp. rotundata]
MFPYPFLRCMNFRMDKKLVQLLPIKLSNNIHGFLRKFLFKVLSFGPMPKHIAFILDGNRRYGKKWNLTEGEGHERGFCNLMTILNYVHEMKFQYVTVYAFSIDNFRRKAEEVQLLMRLIKEKMDALVEDKSMADKLGIRIEFIGKLELLDESVREAAKKLMKTTEKNDQLVLLVSIAYTSTDEIVHGIERSCMEVRDEDDDDGMMIKVVDLEKNMYFGGYPDPDILVRTSGETRLSNFLLWQTKGCLLYAPSCLWPEISLRHLVWAVLKYQRRFSYLERIKKQ